MEKISPRLLNNAMRWRYATQLFDPGRRIPDNEWAAVKDALHHAPSSFGLQPWLFIDVADTQVRKTLMDASWGQRQVVEASHFVVLCAKVAPHESETQRLLQRISAVRGVPFESLEAYGKVVNAFLGGLDDPGFEEWATRQVYIAAGILLQTAALMKIDSCPMEGIRADRYDEILKLNEQGYSAKVACALGYRHADDRFAREAKVRFEVGEIWRTV